MVKVVKVGSKKKKKEQVDRVSKGLEYIRSLKKKQETTPVKSQADWANPKNVKKEDFGPTGLETTKDEEANWAVPKNVKKEEFGPVGFDKSEKVVVKEKKPKPKIQEASWAKSIDSEKEFFGPVGLGVEQPELKPKKTFKQVQTGVKGLDNILDGGIPVGNLITVSGGPGSGKTIMSLQYIYQGAKRYKEPGVFISLEEEPERIIKTGESFGWKINELIKEKKIVIVKVPLYKFEVLKNVIRENVRRIGARRLVIDPGALFELFFDRQIEVRKAIVELGSMLKKLGTTTIVTTEEAGSASFNQGDFSSDGIIYTYYTKISNQFMRMIAVIKMRGTSHSEKIHPLRFIKNGLEVLSEEEVFQDVTSPIF